MPLPSGKIGDFYNQDVTDKGQESGIITRAGTLGDAFSLNLRPGSYIKGQLPPGLELLGGNRIVGTPNSTGVYQFTICSPVSCEQFVMPVSARGQEGWQIVSGELPPGITLLPDGKIVGVPEVGGKYTVLITNGLVTKIIVIDILPASETYGFDRVVLELSVGNVLARRSSWSPDRGWIGGRKDGSRTTGFFYGANSAQVEASSLLESWRLLPEDLLARDWVFSGAVSSNKSMLSTNVQQQIVFNGMPMQSFGRNASVIRRAVQIQGSGRLVGEFFMPVNFNGMLRVEFYSLVNGVVTALRFAMLRVRFLPLALASHMPFRLGTANNWSIVIPAGSSHIGPVDYPASGAHAIYEIVWSGLQDERIEAFVALDLR